MFNLGKMYYRLECYVLAYYFCSVRVASRVCNTKYSVYKIRLVWPTIECSGIYMHNIAEHTLVGSHKKISAVYGRYLYNIRLNIDARITPTASRHHHLLKFFERRRAPDTVVIFRTLSTSILHV